MVLVDTSVWIGHFRGQEIRLSSLLSDGLVLMHPFVLGELACGNLPQRARVLQDLKALPSATAARDSEALRVVEELKLWGKGIGWVDAHLIASALLSNCGLWTLDERLRKAARDAGVRFSAV